MPVVAGIDSGAGFTKAVLVLQNGEGEPVVAR